jgi:hypothetical protein
MSDAPPLLALLSMVPKWNRHWLNTEPAGELPLLDEELLPVPPADVPPLLVEPPDEVPPVEVPPDEIPPLPPVVAALEDVLPVDPPVVVPPATEPERLEPAEALDELLLLVEEEDPPEATTLEPWPPCPAFPLLDEDPLLPPDVLDVFELPPESPP